ncbi:inositol monophosphatase family protein [Streptomyces sp. VRA16 Mangrove soil]|uniref:inositol monophosphatase family protein n=1 Tax=Streptomyces sp. VRA16 Mangrove soil TaxID=2817434 RepID=UPI001A9F3445|nr:inositol monophosphatase family protein [Streptomyces sp. VRA16 Mangrove soil]MBO1334168.1 inositol monophosphatase family protein [Streptomyces sp. VRA16 Mangrove soil]
MVISDVSVSDDPGLALTAALAGARVIRSLYGDDLPRFDKGGGDFATAADLAAEEAILGVLRAARPQDAVTGEESGASGDAGAARRWLVDPLCGTLNYAVRNMLVGVNVALSEGGTITAAATADPFSGEVFWTDGKRSAVRCEEQGQARDTPLVPSALSRLVDINLDAPDPYAPDFRAARLIADPGFAVRFRPRVVSTTLAVAWVAAGRRAAYVTDGDLRDSVHFAAGIALCRDAGCVVSGIEGQPLHTGAGGLIVAADAETHGALVELVRRQG